MSLLQQRVANLEQQIADLECDHKVIKIRFREAINGNRMYKRQCVRCGDLVGNWIPHESIQKKDEIKPVDDSLAANYRQSKFELTKALNQLIRKVQKSEFDDQYQRYLTSPEWHRKRTLIFERCNYLCEGCRINGATIVHHTTYKNIGNEFLFELVGLCKDCHEKYHHPQSEDVRQLA